LELPQAIDDIFAFTRTPFENPIQDLIALFYFFQSF